MPLQKSTYRVIEQLVLIYCVSQSVLDVGADKNDVQAQKEAEKLVDWDYAGLHLIQSIPLDDKLNYHNLCIMRRERQMYDPKRNISQSREQYEVNQYRKLYNAVFSTKPPHLRSSKENYIQFLKDDFFRKQMEPSNPKTSREKYEWFVKKKQGSFFGGKYDFETYLAGNFTARRRRSLDGGGNGNNDDNSNLQNKQKVQTDALSKVETKMEMITSNEVKEMKFEENIANIINILKEKKYKQPREVDTELNYENNNLAQNKEKQNLNDVQDKAIIAKIQTYMALDRKEHAEKKELETNLKFIQTKDRLGDSDKKELLQLEIGVNPIGQNTDNKKGKQSRSNIRARRIRRERINILHNPGNKPLNRSWQLDPRNPWNKNLRYYKHVRLFNDFYIDFYTREGSDKLPSNETYVKIQSPPGFRAGKKNKWSRAWDSQPVSYYVNEMEKMAAQFPKPSKGQSYGVDSKEERRRERDRNMTAKIKEEEINWKRQLSQLRNKLRKKNITQIEYNRTVDEIEKDKKLKYKLYRTRSTQHIIQKAMDQLNWAAEFVHSDIIRDKRDVRSLESEMDKAIGDKFVNDAGRSGRKAEVVKIRSKRVRRDISEKKSELQAKLDNAHCIQRSQEALIGINGEILDRKKRGDYSYHPPKSEEKYRKSMDYEPIARHNAIYDEIEEKTIPPTKKPKETTVLTPEEIVRRKDLLKTFDKEFKSAYKYSDRHEQEFLALRNSLNKTKRKRRALISIDKNTIEHKNNNNIPAALDKLLGIIKTYHNSPKKSAWFSLSNAENSQHLFSHIIGKLRKKRYTIEELLKGPVPDKFEEKKTKLEADKEEAEKKPGLKNIVMEGTENVNKHIHNVIDGNVQDFKVDKNVIHDPVNSKMHPDHPDNNRIDIYAWEEDKQRKYVNHMMDQMDYSLGIRERMHKDYLKMRKEQDYGFIDRGKLNRMELERAHKERLEFLKGQPLPSTTEQVKRTQDLEALSSFQSEAVKKGDKKKKLSQKEKLKEKVEELKDLRAGVL